MSVATSAEHREVYVVQVSCSVKRINRYRGCRKRQRAFVNLRNDVCQGDHQRVRVVGENVLSTRPLRRVTQKGKVNRIANSVRDDRLATSQCRVDIGFGEVLRDIIQAGAVTGVNAIGAIENCRIMWQLSEQSRCVHVF